MKNVVILLFLFSSICVCQILRVPIKLEELSIDVPINCSREVAYTNKQTGVLYTETNGSHRTAWQGWRIMSTEVLEDYILKIEGERLRREEAVAQVFPHQFIRNYSDGVRETVTLLDSIDAFVVELENLNGHLLTLNPYFSNSLDPNAYEIIFQDDVLLTAKKDHLQRTKDQNYPVWIGMTVTNCKVVPMMNAIDTIGLALAPSSLQIIPAKLNINIIFVAGDNKTQTINLAHNVVRNYRFQIEKRKKRMEDLLNRSYVRTNNERFNKALYWAKLSLDALIMNQRSKGIFAGLPWFDNYWGRDSFISLPGATLVVGNFKEAKEILRSFAAWQDTNQNSTDYGRIPNLVTTNSISYNTADGTPRFVIALDEYVMYSGDTAFAREMFPVLKRSIEGTMKYHIDSLCFLTHGDAETWMDAVGPDGAWSPRGNRANDIQSIWCHQLEIGAHWCEFFNDKKSRDLFLSILQTLGENYYDYFINKRNGIPYDYLNINGKPNFQLRPNLIFKFPNQSADIDNNIFQIVTEKLVYPYGIASLSQEDDNFHPYHHYGPYYVPDAAYHNGVVWTWLAGTWIDMATQRSLPNLSFVVTENMINQILDRGAVGTISELLDAFPLPGESEPRLSGAFSQAWSLAEFVRSFYQSYLGIRINTGVYQNQNWSMEVKDRSVIIHPSLPDSITSIDVDILAGKFALRMIYSRLKEETNIMVKPYYQPDSIGIIFVPEYRDLKYFSYGNTRYVNDSSVIGFPVIENYLKKDSSLSLKISKSGIFLYDGDITKNIFQFASLPSPAKYQEMKLATPVIRKDLKCLRPPSYRLLNNLEVKQKNPNAKILYDVVDPEGDDKGPSDYTYPLTPYLKEGSLDITRFIVSSDENNIYFGLRFKNLSNPGWHPEYGFQLTYAAIAIENSKTSGNDRVGMNSNYVFDNGFNFNKIIYVGGGIRVMDDSGKILAEYIPKSDDVVNSLGNANKKLIEFAIPIDVLGVPDSSWRYAILVGAQDDHGGAGIGEFRTVEKIAKEWVGGGKKKPTDPNIYDIILPIQK